MKPMANNTDLISEIEEAKKDAGSWRNILFDQHHKSTRYGKTEIPTQGLFELADYLQKLAATLQRVRDALRWIPVKDWKAKKRDSDFYEVTAIAPGGSRWIRAVLYYSNVSKTFFDPGDSSMYAPSQFTVKAVKPASDPYTPEEK